jgi:hypothetical protein
MLPDAVLVNVPIDVGDANDPDELDNWAVNTLPAVYVPVTV